MPLGLLPRVAENIQGRMRMSLSAHKALKDEPPTHPSTHTHCLQANIALKQQLGLPSEEEQAALAAWMGVGSGGAGSDGDAVEGGALPASEAQGDAAETAAPASPPDTAAEAGQGAERAAGSDDDAAATPGAAAGGSASRGSRRKRGSHS